MDATVADLAARADKAPDAPDYAVIAAHAAKLEDAVLSAVRSGIPIRAAMEGLSGRADYARASEIISAFIADLRREEAQRAAADVPAILLPERFPDPNEAVDASGLSAIPLPERFPEPTETVASAVVSVECDPDVRAVLQAEEALGPTFTEGERRIVARAVNRFRVSAEEAMARSRTARRWSPLSVGRTLRRTRARAPRRAQRAAVAPARDGPPESDAPPPPSVGSPSLSGRVGGFPVACRRERTDPCLEHDVDPLGHAACLSRRQL